MTMGLSSWADTRTWSTPAGESYWDPPATWDEGAVPTASDDVTMTGLTWLTITNAAAANSIYMSQPSA